MPLLEGFIGFPEPKYTRTPNLIFDALLPKLSGSQLKVLLHVVRKTMGWQKDRQAVPISISEIQVATGLSKEPVVDALSFLADANLVFRDKRRSEDGHQAISMYRLRFESDVDSTDEPGSENTTLEEKPRVGKVVEKSDPGGGAYNKVFKERERQLQSPISPSGLHGEEPQPISELLDTTNLEDYNPVGRPGRRVSKLTRDGRDPSRIENREFRRQQREALKTARAEAQEPAIQSEAPSNPRTSSPPPTSALGTNPLPSNIGLPEEAEIWNEIVKHGEPVRLFSWDMAEGKNLSECRNSREFTIERWREACRHIEDVLSGGINKYNQGISVFFRVIEKQDRWWKAINHQYSHLKNRPQDPPPGQPKKADFKKAMEMLKRGEV